MRVSISVVKWFTKIPSWAALSLVMNGLLFTTVLAVSQEATVQADQLLADGSAMAVSADGDDPSVIDAAIADNVVELPHPSGGRKLSYQDWIEVLSSDAKAAASKNPEHLTVLLGDSLSLWVPGELMPGRRVWINQSISGEKTQGLLNRLELLDDNEVEAVFIMIGINDLIWGKADDEI